MAATRNAGTAAAERLRVMRERAAGPAPKAAVQALGQAGETITKVTLSRQTHSAGTPTPSQPGQPPALVSGTLRRAVHRTPAVRSGPASYSQVLGCRVIYGAVQEYGATIRVRNARVLANADTGQVFGTQVTLPARPWMKPSMRQLEASGLGRAACARAFYAVLITGL